MNPLAPPYLLKPIAYPIWKVATMKSQRYQRDLCTYRLLLPHDSSADVIMRWLGVMTGMYHQNMLGMNTSPALAFEVDGNEDGIHYRLHVPRSQDGFVTGQLGVLMPEAHAIEEELEDQPEPPEWKYGTEIGETDVSRSLRIKDKDDIRITAWSLLGALDKLGHGEHIRIQIIAAPAAVRRPPRDGKTQIHLPFKIATFEADKDHIKDQREKTALHNFNATLRVVTTASTDARAKHLLNLVMAPLRVLGTHGNSLTRSWSSAKTVIRRVNQVEFPTLYRAQFSDRELAALMAWPIENPPAAGLEKPTTRHMRPDREFPTGPITLARSTVPGPERLLGFRPEDTNTHVEIIGRTGTGKSTLIKVAISHLLALNKKHGFIFINPKSEMNEDVLALIPPERRGDVIYLNPLDPDMPVGINPLQGQNPAKVASFLLDVFTSLWDAGIQTGDVLYNAIYTVASKPGMTLHEVALILTSPEFCDRMTADLPEGPLRDFWDGYKAKRSTERERMYEPVMRRLRPFLRPQFAAIFGQSQGIDVRRVLAEGKIVIVNASVGELGEDAAYLFAAMVVAMFWQHVQERPLNPADDMREFFGLFDEFHKYMKLPTEFDVVAATARGYHFPLWLAHQDMNQLGRLSQAIQTNCRNRVIFPSNPNDASQLARELGIHPEDITKLGRWHTILMTTVNGRQLPPATGYTLEPPEQLSSTAEVKEESRRNYGTPIDLVNQQIKERRHIDFGPGRPRARLGG